jgi:phosphohistidine phosphatase
MKTLLLLRHAKSSWNDPNLADFDRPLNERGFAAAAFMGEMVGSRVLVPEAIVCSPAKRAVQTAEILKATSELGAPVRLDERIYEASPQTLHLVASQFGNELSSVMMIGHNPGLEGFIVFLTGSVEPMPTAGLAVIEIAVDVWSDLQNGAGRVVEVIRPKDEMQKIHGDSIFPI